MNTPKIFGRDPALWSALAYTVITMVSAFCFTLTIDQQGTLNAIVAAILGVVVAFMLKADGQVAAITGLFKAAFAVAISFGLHFPPEKQAIAMSFVAAILAFVVRSNVTPTVPQSSTTKA